MILSLSPAKMGFFHVSWFREKLLIIKEVLPQDLVEKEKHSQGPQPFPYASSSLGLLAWEAKFENPKL